MALVKFPPFIMMASALAVLLPGCRSSEEGERTPPPAPRQQPPAPRESPAVKMEFETRTDTVTALHQAEHRNAGSQGLGIHVRFMVQIGAFKDPNSASAVQAEARSRYHMPVLNDYHAGSGLYQIRIGFFESRESARTFLRQMQQQHPKDYRNSWIVQLKR